MLPEFPKFKPIELSDKEDVEAITHKFPPYSDFNFVSMWSWDIQGQMRLSVLNGNLVVRFTDYLTGKPFYSFLGDNMVNETAGSLFELSAKEGLKPELKLMPEHSIKGLNGEKFKIIEDRDNFDYLLDVQMISEYNDARLRKKNQKANHFVKSFPNLCKKNIDFTNVSIQRNILSLEEIWLKNNTEKDSDNEGINDFSASKRFFELNSKDIFGIGIFSDNTLIGYSFSQTLPNTYSIGHFSKADTHFKGIYEYLTREGAKLLMSRGYSLWNYEQDLGIKGLRESKESYLPCKYLKKFVLSIVDIGNNE